jgi:hypothetical protein
MEKFIRTYFRQENKNALRHVTFLRHATLAGKPFRNRGKIETVEGLKSNRSKFLVISTETGRKNNFQSSTIDSEQQLLQGLV